jgi:site-specific recombinase XerD
MNRPNRTPLAPLLQQFFIDRLQKQRQTSPCTISAYRDTFRLFLAFAEAKLRKRPSDLTIEDLTTHLILAFLDHLERNRKNTSVLATPDSQRSALSYNMWVSRNPPPWP